MSASCCALDSGGSGTGDEAVEEGSSEAQSVSEAVLWGTGKSPVEANAITGLGTGMKA